MTLSGSGLSGVTMALSGSQNASTTTNAGGSYSFTVPGGGNYIVTPSLTGYSFTPPSATFTNLAANQTANFAAASLTISGQVTLSGLGVSGVTVTLSGSQSGPPPPIPAGNSFNVPGGGRYTVTPSFNGYSFNPPNATFNNCSSSQTANFAVVTYSISGQVTLSGSG